MRERRKLIIIGGKGNGTVVASTVEDMIADGGDWEILGFLNDGEQQIINGYPVLGKPEEVKRYTQNDCYFFYGLISVKVSIPRVERLNRLGAPAEKFATLVHPTACVARKVEFGYGVAIGPFTFIGPNARFGNHILVHGHCYVGRDTTLKSYCYLAPRATVGAEVVLEEGAYLGMASTVDCVREPVVVGTWSVVGMGAVVIHSVPPYVKVVGIPARPIGTVDYRVHDHGQE